MRGTPGVATQRAVVNFFELAQKERQAYAQRIVLSDASGGAFSPASESGSPPSPEPASSFLAYEDDGVTDLPPPDTHGAVGRTI
jgi:hypothetical protein